jgi:hypothetical protein
MLRPLLEAQRRTIAAASPGSGAAGAKHATPSPRRSRTNVRSPCSARRPTSGPGSRSRRCGSARSTTPAAAIAPAFAEAEASGVRRRLPRACGKRESRGARRGAVARRALRSPRIEALRRWATGLGGGPPTTGAADPAERGR